MLSRIFCAAAACALFVASAAAQPARDIVHVRGHVYKVQDGDRATVFFETPDGIVVADTLSVPTARWLRAELERRFPGVPVRYVVPTSPSFDRAAGADTFRPEATVVGEARFNSAVQRAAERLPPSLVALDLNHNGRLEQDEWQRSPRAGELSEADADGNGVLTIGELYAQVPRAYRTFRSRITLDFGADAVDVRNPADASLDRTTVLLFPAERLLFTSSGTVARGSFSLDEARPQPLIDWMRAIAKLPFDDMLTATGELTSHAELEVRIAYAEDLLASVVSAYHADRPATRAAAAPSLAKYAGSAHDGSRGAAAQSMYDRLRATRVDVHASAMGRRSSAETHYCARFDTCASGGVVGGGTMGVGVTASRVGVLVEVNLADQLIAHRESALYNDAFAYRSSRGSLLLRFGESRPKAFTYDLLGGWTLLVSDVQGLSWTKEGFAPTAGRHPFAKHASGVGFTAGVNAVWQMTAHVGLVVPVRITASPQPLADFEPAHVDVQAGIGLRLRVAQILR